MTYPHTGLDVLSAHYVKVRSDLVQCPARIDHSLEACDRYYEAFKKVRKLHEDGRSPEVIAAELEMSSRLVLQ